MTFHAVRRKRIAKGHQLKRSGSVRIMSSYNPEDFAIAQWWADKEGVPVAKILRAALWAYLQCVRPDWLREKGKE